MVIVVAAAAVTVGLAAPAHAGTIVLANGDFETGNLTGWNTWQSGVPNDTVEVVSSPTHDGSYALKQAGVGTSTVGQMAVTGLTAGEQFDLSAWCSLGTALTDSNWGGIGYWWQATETSTPVGYDRLMLDSTSPVNTWTQFTSRFTTPEGMTCFKIEAAAVLGGGATPGGTVYFDNVSISSVPEPSTLVLLGCGLSGILCYAWRKRR
jgi:hypothetical protein